MNFENFKVGMKITSKVGPIYEVIGINSTKSVTVKYSESKGEFVILPASFYYFFPYVEKKRVKLYHRLWKYDNNPRVQISSSTAFFGPFADRSVITLKEWEEEIEYEVKD